MFTGPRFSFTRLAAAAFVALVLPMASCSSDADDETLSTASDAADPIGYCDGSQLELNSCVADALKEAEAALANILGEAQPHARGRLEALHESQTVWLAYRDDFCEAHGLEQGSIQDLNVATCKLDLTMDRSEDICDWLIPNGDLDGVVNPPETCRRFRT